MLQFNVAQIGACETVLLSRPYVINLDQPAKPTFRSRYARTPFGHGTEWRTDGHSRI